MPEPPHTPGGVFLSYAREDTDPARRIAEAMRAFGVDVWFDQSELRGGDSWDAKLRMQIRTCTLFLPVISATTQARSEGYFRREWKLAIERTYDMAAGKPFLVPVVIDDTAESAAVVPDEFMRVQWTRLANGVPTAQFIEHVKRLLEGNLLGAGRPRPAVAGAALDDARGRRQAPPLPVKPAIPGWTWGALAAVLMALIAGIFALRRAPVGPVSDRPHPEVPASTAATTPVANAKSIAVLPFANLSTDKENEFFADGVQDDVITNLAKIRDLTVISRTSTLAYRDAASRNLKKIATELGVAAILEGSVRRVGSKVHMNAQLIDARTDAHLWADTFDGDTGDIFALQAKLAQQIAAALRVTLTGSERALIERRPTENQEAYELYLRGRLLKQATSATSTRPEYEASVSLYEQAVARDPDFALAHVDLAYLHGVMYWFGQIDPTPERRARAQAELATAQRLAPDAPETRIAQGAFAYLCENDWEKALDELRAAETRLPNDDQLQYLLAITYRRLGRLPEAIGAFERAVTLNPHDRRSGTSLIETLVAMRRYAQLPALVPRFSSLFPDDSVLTVFFVDMRFALSGDHPAWVRERAALPGNPLGDKDGLGKACGDALRAGDLAAAERILADPRLSGLPAAGGVISLPTAIIRAELALLRGDGATARQRAAEAVAALQAGHWAPRQQLAVRVGLARARLCAGERGSVAELQQALEEQERRDKFVMVVVWLEAARTFAVTGHTEEALACLRRAAAGPCMASPEQLRHDPFLIGLKADPRFEEILKSAKPL